VEFKNIIVVVSIIIIIFDAVFAIFTNSAFGLSDVIIIATLVLAG